jgi:hypothetical protein
MKPTPISKPRKGKAAAHALRAAKHAARVELRQAVDRETARAGRAAARDATRMIREQRAWVLLRWAIALTLTPDAIALIASPCRTLPVSGDGQQSTAS